MRLRPYQIFRVVLSVLAALVFIPIVGEYAIVLAQELGLYQHPLAQVEAALSLLEVSPASRLVLAVDFRVSGPCCRNVG